MPMTPTYSDDGMYPEPYLTTDAVVAALVTKMPTESVGVLTDVARLWGVKPTGLTRFVNVAAACRVTYPKSTHLGAYYAAVREAMRQL